MLTFMDTRLVGLFGGMSAHLMADSAGPSDGHWRALLVLVFSGIQNSEKSILAENTTNHTKYTNHTSFIFIQLHSLISIEVKHARWSGEAGLWPAQIVLKASKASLSALRWSALRLFGQRLSCCLTPATNGNDFSKKPSKHDSGWLRATDCPFVDLKVFQSLEPLRFPAFPRRVDTQSISELCYWWLWI